MNKKVLVPGVLALTLLLAGCSELSGEGDDDDAKPGGVPQVVATPTGN